MIDNDLRLPLSQDGAVTRWLACGPVLTPLQQLESLIDPRGPAFGAGRRWILSYWAFSPASLRLKTAIYNALEHPAPPTDPIALSQTGPAGQRWRYVTVAEDRMVDFSGFNFAPTRMQGWLFTGLACTGEVSCEAELLTIGPARVWLDDVEVMHSVSFSYVEPIRVPIRLRMGAGQHRLLVHGEMLGWREARLGLGLRFVGAPPLWTSLPIGRDQAQAWQAAEVILDNLRLSAFAVVERPLALCLAPDAQGPANVCVEAHPLPPFFVPSEAVGEILAPARSQLVLSPGGCGAIPSMHSLQAALARLPEGHSVEIRLSAADGPPVTATRRVWVNRAEYSEQPYGDYEGRRQEAREHLAEINYDVHASMAAVTLGRAAKIDSRAIDRACDYLEQRLDCADFFALALLALLYRYGENPALDRADGERITQAFLGFKYWIDEPGLDGMCYITENHQILFHVTAYLAGQLWPDRVFANSGLTGRQQMQRARRRLETWILRRLQGGFSEWDSNTYLVMDAYAMLSLVEYAASPRLREMATSLLHKIFFIIASQSFRGAHGSSHGRCYVEGLKTARADATSGLQRIAWGMGNFNGETFATGALALARRYHVPDVLQRIGAELPPVLTTLARSRGRYRPHFDIHRGEWDVRTMTRRTPAVMLSAAIDYRPGQRGIQEHLWQATLGPEAVVFTTYPGNSQEHGNARPNFWAGSVRLPRVAMYDRTVICHYAIDPAVGLGYAHAYFPVAAFDAARLSGPWAFARRGEGYVALWGHGALRLTERGRHAGQELRSTAGGSAWVCCVGSAAEDGDWPTFCARLEANPPTLVDGVLRFQTPEGARLIFGWDGPLVVDDAPVSWEHFPHYDNRYTHTPMGADTMVIACGDTSLTLDLREGRCSEQGGTR